MRVHRQRGFLAKVGIVGVISQVQREKHVSDVRVLRVGVNAIRAAAIENAMCIAGLEEPRVADEVLHEPVDHFLHPSPLSLRTGPRPFP